MFQQSLENIELEKMRDDQKVEDGMQVEKYQCVTPEKKEVSNVKGNEMIFSSNKKISTFETPKGFDKKGAQYDSSHLQEVQYAIQDNDKRQATDAKRQLIRPSASGSASVEGSEESKLSSIKRYIDKDDGSIGQGLILSHSSKSVIGLDAFQDDFALKKDKSHPPESLLEQGSKYKTDLIEVAADNLTKSA